MATDKIVDAQVHLNLLGSVDTAISVMDAVGIDAVLFDEWWGWDAEGERRPNFRLANGAVRHLYPIATEAAYRYPDRFAYAAWVHRADPAIEEVLQLVVDNPQQVCLRVPILAKYGDVVALEEGAYSRLFTIAERYQIPVKIGTSAALESRSAVLRPHMERFEGIQFIVDHCGAIPVAKSDLSRGPEVLDYAIVYADLPNVSIQWSRAQTHSRKAFPHDDVTPYLRRYIDEFGSHRILWGSDYTQTRGSSSWADALMYIRMSSLLSFDEKLHVLGRNAQRILGWPS
jgi:L-fuconolactonase